MIKTGNLNALFRVAASLMVLVLFSPNSTQAQDFNLEATVSEKIIFIGEQFSITVEVQSSSSRNVSMPTLPDIRGVGVLSSTPSRSTSISIVNGRTQTSTAYTFTMIARERGQHTIPPITVEIDGETHRTDPIQIEVTERGNLAREGGQQLPDIFIEVNVDDNNPVPGQQIVATLDLFFKQGIEITSFQPSAGWRTDGFWKEQLQNTRHPEAESVILDGVRYRKATLIRYALFPSRSGELTLASFPLNVGIRTQPSRNDRFGSFFGSGTNQRRVSVESEPVHISVQPLPVPERPSVMMNAVGDLQVERRLNRTEVETGETLELITTIEGTGNIPLVRRPNFQLPEGVDLYTPQENSNVERQGMNIRGEKTFTELMVARAPGRFEIPAEDVAIYDPVSGRYQYAELPALEFEALPSASQQIAAAAQNTGTLQTVSGLAVWHNSSAQSLYRSAWFWILLLIPGIALAIAWQQRRYHQKLNSDTEFARSRKAGERAAGHLSAAESAISEGNPKIAYSLMHKAITGFVCDRMKLPEAGLSDQQILEHVSGQNPAPALMKSLRTLLNKCATISYAPAGDSADQMADLQKTRTLISDLKKLL
jgi:hypothetical protein